MARNLMIAILTVVAMAASPVLLAQEGPSDSKATDAAGASIALVPAEGDEESPESADPKKEERKLAFLDFSYRFHIEDGSPQPASFHDYRLSFGIGKTSFEKGELDKDDQWWLGYSRLTVHGRSHSRKRGAMDAFGVSIAFGSASLKHLNLGDKDDDASAEDDGAEDVKKDGTQPEVKAKTRPYRVSLPRTELELGVAHTSRFWIGAPGGSRVDMLSGRTGFRIGILTEIQATIGEDRYFGIQYSYAREYYSSSATIKDTTILVKTDVAPWQANNLSFSVGHRRLSAKNFHRTMFFFGVEVAF